MNRHTHKVVQSLNVGDDPDVLASDPGTGTLHVAGEAGIVSMFTVGKSTIAKTGEGSIGSNAHVVGVDPSSHRVCFPLKNVDGRPLLGVMAPR